MPMRTSKPISDTKRVAPAPFSTFPCMESEANSELDLARIGVSRLSAHPARTVPQQPRQSATHPRRGPLPEPRKDRRQAAREPGQEAASSMPHKPRRGWKVRKKKDKPLKLLATGRFGLTAKECQGRNSCREVLVAIKLFSDPSHSFRRRAFASCRSFRDCFAHYFRHACAHGGEAVDLVSNVEPMRDLYPVP